MQKIQLAKSPAGAELLSDWYDRFEQRLGFPAATRRLETSFGFSDVVATGAAARDGYDASVDGAPVVLLHGAMAGAPHALGELADLPGRLPFYAVNIPSQSVHAEAVRLSFRTDEYGRWLTEILDQLELPAAIVCGVSWGGAVALELARTHPERVAGLILAVPASIVRGPVLRGLVEIALPMLRFQLFPNESNRDRAFRALLTTPDETWSAYLADAMRHWKMDFSAPPLVTPSDMAGLEAPVYVVAADEDLSFPGEPLLARAEQVFPNLIGSRLLRETRHVPSFRPADQAELAGLIEAAIGRMREKPATLADDPPAVSPIAGGLVG